MKTYSEKLKDPRWQKKRLEILQRDNFKCVLCKDSETELHINHLKYTGNPWEAPSRDLETLCKDCHLLKHSAKERIYYTLKVKDEGNDVTYIIYNNDLGSNFAEIHQGKLTKHCGFLYNSKVLPLLTSINNFNEFISIDFGDTKLSFNDFGGEVSMKRMIEVTILKDKLKVGSEVQLDRTTHSTAIEFFVIIKNTKTNIILKHSGGVS